jgi:hypothetical protein
MHQTNHQSPTIRSVIKKYQTLLFIIAVVTGFFFFHYLFSLLVVYFLPRMPFLATFPPQGVGYIWPAYFVKGAIPTTSLPNLWEAHGWDSTHYMFIIRNGYDAIPFELKVHSWAFYPLYPLIVKAIAWILDSVEDIQTVFTIGVLLSTSSFIAGLILLKRLIRVVGFPKIAFADFLLLLLAFPTSYFFILFYTESLFFFLTILFFTLLFARQYVMATLIMGLAMVTRSTGLILVPLFLLYFVTREWSLAKSFMQRLLILPKALFFSGISFLPLYLFFSHLESLTGEFWAAYKLQAVWKNTFLPFGYITKYIEYYGYTIQLHHILSVVLLLVLCLGMVWAVIAYIRSHVEITHNAEHAHENVIFSGYAQMLTRYYRLPTPQPTYTIEQVTLFLYAGIYLFLLLSITSLSSIFRYANVNFMFFLLPLMYTRLFTNKYVLMCTIMILTLFHALFFVLFLTQVPAYGF